MHEDRDDRIQKQAEGEPERVVRREGDGPDVEAHRMVNDPAEKVQFDPVERVCH